MADARSFVGYAAIFDVPDNIGDVIRPGAFARSLRSGANPPLLREHCPAHKTGRVDELWESRRGLKVRFTAAASDAGGLSIGYRVRKHRDVGGGRELLELELVEISLVLNPLHPLARYTPTRATGRLRDGVETASGRLEIAR